MSDGKWYERRFGSLGLPIFFIIFFLFRYSTNTAKSQVINPCVVPLGEFPLLVRLGILFFYIFFMPFRWVGRLTVCCVFAPLPGKEILVHLALCSVI